MGKRCFATAAQVIIGTKRCAAAGAASAPGTGGRERRPSWVAKKNGRCRERRSRKASVCSGRQPRTAGSDEIRRLRVDSHGARSIPFAVGRTKDRPHEPVTVGSGRRCGQPSSTCDRRAERRSFRCAGSRDLVVALSRFRWFAVARRGRDASYLLSVVSANRGVAGVRISRKLGSSRRARMCVPRNNRYRDHRAPSR